MRTFQIASGVVLVVLLCAVPGAASAQTTDPQFRADIEKLMQVTGAANLGTQMANLAAGQLIDRMKQVQPGTPDRVFEIIREVLNSEFSQAFVAPDGLQSKMVDVYAKHFTHDEVSALLTFYGTPVGRKTVTLMPMLVQEGSAVGQKWAEANMARISGVLRERLQKEGFN